MANGDDIRTILQALLAPTGAITEQIAPELEDAGRAIGLGAATTGVADTSANMLQALEQALPGLEERILDAPVPSPVSIPASTRDILGLLGVDVPEPPPTQAELGERENVATEALRAAQERASREDQQRRDFNEALRRQVESGDFNFTVRDDEIIPTGATEAERLGPELPREASDRGTVEFEGRRIPTARRGGFSEGARDPRLAMFEEAGFSPEEARQLTLTIPRGDRSRALEVVETKRQQDRQALQDAIRLLLQSPDPSAAEIGGGLAIQSIDPEMLQRAIAIVDALKTRQGE